MEGGPWGAGEQHRKSQSVNSSPNFCMEVGTELGSCSRSVDAGLRLSLLNFSESADE